MISKISKEFIYLDSEKRNNPIFKWVKDLNKYFFQKKDLQMTNRYLVLEKVLDITSYFLINGNQNHNEISPHTY